jgi:hypothetical protein
MMQTMTATPSKAITAAMVREMDRRRENIDATSGLTVVRITVRVDPRTGRTLKTHVQIEAETDERG